MHTIFLAIGCLIILFIVIILIFWDKLHHRIKKAFLILGILPSALIAWSILNFLGKIYDTIFLGKRDVLDLFIIEFNIWLLFLIILVAFAVWTRLFIQGKLDNTEIRLKEIESQLGDIRYRVKKIEQVKQDSKFNTASNLLIHNGSKTSLREGLYILRDLVKDDPNIEYIRCVEIISRQLIECEEGIGKEDLLDALSEITRIRTNNKELEEIIGNYKVANELLLWPCLKNINLQNANLIVLNLRSANLKGANFNSANLESVNLFHANLKGANFNSANLKSTDLSYANLKGVNFNSANLKAANIIGEVALQDTTFIATDLQDADLYGDLGNADFSNANMRGADLSNTDMRLVKGLDKEQILSAKWTRHYCSPPYYFETDMGQSPKLPDYLMDDLDVLKWLNELDEDKAKKTKKTKIKKSKAKKPKN